MSHDQPMIALLAVGFGLAFVLGAIAKATEGTSVVANLSLARNNARVAGELAVALSA